MRVHLTARFIVLALLAGLASSSGRAHSIPSHLNVTTAAVGWLLEAQPRLACTPSGKEALTKALLVGTEHEDDNYNDSSSAARMGRYQFHFLPALDDSFAALEIGPFAVAGSQLSLGTLDLGVFRALNGCSSLEWGGFARNGPGNVTCSYNALRAQTLTMTNVNTWGNAVADAKRASTGAGYAGFSEGFVKLGFLIHLIEDQSSPAHALNAAHGHVQLALDILAALDPQAKGQTVDLGFPDAMEVDPVGNDARRDVPPGLWPPRVASQLLDASPDEILKAMHTKTTSQGYRRETMSQRTGRMFKNVESRVEGRVPDIAKNIGLPWPLGRETLQQDIQRLKSNIAQIVRDEIEKEAKAEIAATLARSVDAAREWTVLGPEAVRLSASLLWKYISTASPVMGSGAATCTVKAGT